MKKQDNWNETETETLANLDPQNLSLKRLTRLFYNAKQAESIKKNIYNNELSVNNWKTDTWNESMKLKQNETLDLFSVHIYRSK